MNLLEEIDLRNEHRLELCEELLKDAEGQTTIEGIKAILRGQIMALTLYGLIKADKDSPDRRFTKINRKSRRSHTKSNSMKKDWERLEEIYEEVDDIAKHHDIDEYNLLLQLQNLIDEVKTIEEN